MKYNMKNIMSKAWEISRKYKELSFGECLHRAWLSAKAVIENEARVALAKAKAGIEEVTDTWYGWKKRGYEVVHGSKALFGCELIYGEKGDNGIYKASFFGFSQVA